MSTPSSRSSCTRRWNRRCPRSRRSRGRSAATTRLLQKPGEPSVLEHAAAGLLLRAVGGHVLGEVDRREGGAAAGAWLALAPVDLERHRQLVRNHLADHLLVALDRLAGHVEGAVEALHLLGLELGPLFEGR